MTLDFDAVNGTVTGFGIIQIINVQVNYTGTYDHPDFTLQGSYTFGLLWPVLHNETWTLTLAPPVGTTPATFSGTLQDTGESTDFLVQGIKTGP